MDYFKMGERTPTNLNCIVFALAMFLIGVMVFLYCVCVKNWRMKEELPDYDKLSSEETKMDQFFE